MRLSPLPLVAVLGFFCSHASAQLVTQTLDLSPGWNAVYLEVTPLNDDPDVVFAGLAVESAWQFVPRTQVTKFIDDPSELIPESDDWLSYFPPTSPNRPALSLHALNGGTCYLIKLGGGSAVNVSITGKPSILPVRWGGDAYDLVGFPVVAADPPTFAQFFAASPAHVGQAVYRLNGASGRWETITASSDMRRGEAFWIYTNGESQYQGPFEFDTIEGAQLDFSTDMTTIRGSVVNKTNSTTTVTLTLSASAAPAVGDGVPLLAGDVPLSRWSALAGTNPVFDYLPFTTYDISVPANSLEEFEIAVRRADMVPFSYPAGSSAVYQSILNVTSPMGSLVVVPVSSSGPATVAGSRRGGTKGVTASTPLDRRSGLWVGTAAVSKVSEAGSAGDRTIPTDTLTEFQFPIIVHVDAAGQAKFLQQVYLMYKPPVMGPDPEVVGYQVEVTPGRYVLVTNDALLSQFQGVRMVENSNIGRRISTSAFSFRTPQAMTQDNMKYSCDVVLDYDDALNPFKHKYHNFHDNKDAAFNNTLPEGVEAYTVGRLVELDFSNAVPDDYSGAGFGDTVASGVYRETITGLHRETIYVQGTFRLANISSVEVLNDGI